MTTNNERTELITQYLIKNADKVNELLSMPAEEALKIINADGYDFSVEELVNFAEALNIAVSLKTGELDENDLDNVNGGCDPVTLASLLVLCTIVYVSATAVEIWLKCRTRKK